MDNSLLANTLLPLSLFVIMLGVGMTLKPADFLRVVREPKAILVGLFGQLILLPILGLLVVTVYQLPPVFAVGLLILCFAPGGATSNILTLVARGDTALSISMTAVAGVLIPFTLPILTYYALNYWMGEQAALAFPVLKSMLQILIISVVPALLGMVFRHYFPELCQRLNRSIKVISILFIITVVIGLVGSNRELLWSQISLLSAPVITLCSLALLMGWGLSLLAQLQTERQLAVSLEIGIQNAGTAILVSAALLNSPEMALVALCYGVLMNGPAMVILAYRNRDLLLPRGVVTSG